MIFSIPRLFFDLFNSIFLKPTVGVKRGTVHKITALPVGLSEMPEMTLEDLDSLASAALRRRTNRTASKTTPGPFASWNTTREKMMERFSWSAHVPSALKVTLDGFCYDFAANLLFFFDQATKAAFTS